EPLAIDEPAPAARGHAIECRIYAEESGRPSGGVVRRLHVPGGPGIRVDLGVGAGETITAHYDALLAKLVAHGQTRAEAIARLRAALDEFRIDGPPTTLALHRRIVRDPGFVAGGVQSADPGRLPRDDGAGGGGEARVGVSLDTARLAGRTTKTVNVYTNDPDAPVVGLSLAGQVLADLILTPQPLYLGHLRRGEAVRREVIVTSGRPGDRYVVE